MTNPKEQGLILLKDEQQNAREIRLDPQFFSRDGLKKIIQCQVSRSDIQTEVTISKRDAVFYPAGLLRKIKELSRIEQDEFFNATAWTMLNAREIIIKRVT